MSIIFPLFNNRFLALVENSSLLPNLPEVANDFLISVVEPVDCVGDFDFLTKFHDEFLGPAEVVSRDTGEEVMDCLGKELS